MGSKAGLGLKFLQWFLRGVQFLCAALILGIFSYFLATLHNHDLHIATSIRAVEGISGAAVLYTLIGLLLLCCVAGLAVTSFIAMVLDVAFIGAFIYVAYTNRHGASSCRGYVDTPFGRGNSRDTNNAGSDGFTALPSYRTACRLQSAALAVAIIAIVFFLLSILVELALVRHHRKEKRFGPSPKNNYTSGYGSEPKKTGFLGRFRRGRKGNTAYADNNTLPEHATPADLRGPTDNRASYNTDTTAIGETREQHKVEAGYGCPAQQYGIATDEPARTYGGHPAAQETYPPQAPAQARRYDDGIY